MDLTGRFSEGKGGAGDRNRGRGGLDMIDGRFNVFAQYASNQMPLLVGKIVEVVLREEENE